MSVGNISTMILRDFQRESLTRILSAMLFLISSHIVPQSARLFALDNFKRLKKKLKGNFCLTVNPLSPYHTGVGFYYAHSDIPDCQIHLRTGQGHEKS